MQANAEQQVRRRGDRAMQLALNCNLPPDTRFTVSSTAISRGFDSDNVDICKGTAVRFSDGAVYKDNLGGAIAHAAVEFHCTNVNLVPFYQQLSGGQEGLDYAANIGLPPGFVAAPVYNGDRAIVRVNIYTETGDWYSNYHMLAPLGIDVANITCAFWQERLGNAVDNHLPNDGWSIVLRNNGYVGSIYSPSGDEFRSLQAAWITAGVIFPHLLLSEAMREFKRIVENLNGSVTTSAFARLTDVSRATVKRFLSDRTVNHESIYNINLVFGPNYDVNTLTNAARDAGVLEQQDIQTFDFQMTTYMQRLSLRAQAVPLPEPFARAGARTNEYEWWANANAPRIVVGQQLNQIPAQEAVVAEAPVNHQADLPPPLQGEVAEAPIAQADLPPLPAREAVAEAPFNQADLPPLPVQVQVQVQVDPPPQDADEESANFVAV